MLGEGYGTTIACLLSLLVSLHTVGAKVRVNAQVSCKLNSYDFSPFFPLPFPATARRRGEILSHREFWLEGQPVTFAFSERMCACPD